MHILFVDDCPNVKLVCILEYLKTHHPAISYVIHESYNSACKYLNKHLSEIDLVVVDLGLPIFDNGSGYNELEGLNVIRYLMRKTFNIPVIINSSTEIPSEKEYLKQYALKNAQIVHVDCLCPAYFDDFLKKS